MSFRVLLSVIASFVLPCLNAADAGFSSAFLRLQLSREQPAFTGFAIDSLGRNAGKLAVNLLHPPLPGGARYTLSHAGSRWEYRPAGEAPGSPAAWSFSFSPRSVSLRSSAQAAAFVLRFNNVICHATLLGHMNDDGSVQLPALLHMPDYGTIRITTDVGPGVALGYDASRGREGNFVRVEFPAGHRYRWDVVAIYPGPPQLARDARFDAYRRNYLTALQLNPRYRSLANHSASDPAALTFFQYSLIARYAPPLAEGLRATDLVRYTLERHLAGFVSYGMKGYRGVDAKQERYPFNSLDTFPSLLATAADYVEATGDRAWLASHYAGLKAWAEKMIDFDADHDGLLEFPLSGNAGSWPRPMQYRPANWWDCVGYGHKDAYSNALAYRALVGLTKMADMAGKSDDAAGYRRQAAMLKAAYAKTFYNPDTGVLAGWVSADGKVHDYYFTSVNGLAIASGLVPPELANRIMDRMLAKMKQVGFTRFDLGLPGNLVPVRREDYPELSPRFGGSRREDGSDGFQVYENGGATACHVYWTIQALYNLGRRAEAEKMLFPLLHAFEEGRFQGVGSSDGRTNDWKAWDGTPHGYEGILVDNYLALLAVYTGYLDEGAVGKTPAE